MVKKLFSWSVIVLVFAFANSAALADTTPEFDGAYLKDTNGKYTEIKTTAAFYTAVARQGQHLMEVLGLRPGPYVVDKSLMPTSPASTFKGFFLKGKHEFKFFSLHPLRERRLQSNEGFYENHGPAKPDEPFYIPGNEIDIRQKAVGSDAYYFEPRDVLAKGDYVGWIGNNLWLFKLD